MVAADSQQWTSFYRTRSAYRDTSTQHCLVMSCAARCHAGARAVHRAAAAAARRDGRKCQNDGVQNGGARFRRSGAVGAPAAVSRPSMSHITWTSWYPQVCTSLWRSTIPPLSALPAMCKEKEGKCQCGLDTGWHSACNHSIVRHCSYTSGRTFWKQKMYPSNSL
jgi:hypothetical protein